MAAQQRLFGGPDAAGALALQRQLVQQAEQALGAGDATTARQALERAALMVHAPEVEIGLVRADMQAGDYRRALSFAAHAAGAHRNLPAGTALYAWLLQLGGQGVYAQRLMGEALARSPDDAALQAVQAQLHAPWPQVPPLLLQPPLRAAPHASGAAPPATARLGGTALLAADGRHALVPASAVPAGARLWLRNGLGQTVAVSGSQPAADGRLLRLQLQQALPGVPGLAASVRPPFAGSPGYTVEYAEGPGTAAHAAAPARWPLLRQGFFGRPSATTDRRPLGIDAPPGARGGPVFDAFGDLAGIALPGAGGPDELLAVQTLAAELGLAPAASATAAAPGTVRERAPVDTVYEAGLRLALQLLVVDRP